MERNGGQRYEAYKAYMRQHHKVVWGVCYDFVRGDAERCKDMVQEVWLALWLRFDQQPADTAGWRQRAWLRRVVKNVLVDLYRAAKNDPLAEASDLSDLPDQPNNTSQQYQPYQSDQPDLAETIDDLLATLAPDEQRLMRMRLDGYSADEIAATIGTNRNAIYQRVNRIITKLRRYATGL